MQVHHLMRPKNLSGSMALAMVLVPWVPALAGPDACTVNGTAATCEGDQSAGIQRTTPPSELNVWRLDGQIAPVHNAPGIRLISNGAGNAVINSGESLQSKVMIETHGTGATGIIGIAQGVPSTQAPDDAFLNVPLLGVNPAVGGGAVQINSFSDITTNNNAAHAIQGYSASPGYPESVLQKLRDFTETGFTFAVTQALDASGTPVPLAGSSIQLRGHLIDADGHVLMSDGNPVEYGTFTLYADGHFDVQYSADELAVQTALGQGQSFNAAVNYTVQGNRAGNTQNDDGKLIITFKRNAQGSLTQTREAWFETFGVSGKPSADTSPTVFPDLKRYVTTLLDDAQSGGMGGSVAIVSNGHLTTKGTGSHGIYAYSQGGTGAYGSHGSIGHSAGGGGAGSNAGAVTVTANGSITTQQEKANGIVAVSAGGTGGHGGDGGAWRWGQKGGTGGTGGLVTVNGSAKIKTSGNYSSGITALSVGGNGGEGGSGSGAMPGGSGGAGGKGGEVLVNGTWDITTGGNWAYGIWAKSLGGNAGNGGCAGWLSDDPGMGGKATDGGKVTLHSSGTIQTSGVASYGLYGQSVGGFGGMGGSSWGLFWSFGGSGDSGGSGGEVEVSNLASGFITTNNEYSHGILAQSIGGGGGGGGGGDFALVVSLGGGGASGGNGGKVIVENDGAIQTGLAQAEDNHSAYSHGILAQSIGGGGGDGAGAAGLVSIGGKGSNTSDGGVVEVTNRGSIKTYGIQSRGIYAQSIGGGGGDGGRSVGLVSIGGGGGGGGNANNVTVKNFGSVHTYETDSEGIFAQSVGGGGGSGGDAYAGAVGGISLAFAIGGAASKGGNGTQVLVDNAGSITTERDLSIGIFAQSIGGGGGNGGFAGALTSGTVSFGLTMGGSGGAGGLANQVDVTNEGDIFTGSVITVAGKTVIEGDNAIGILAQSIGGGGGNGGSAFSGSAGIVSVSTAVGGKGGSGNDGGVVNVTNEGSIGTKGANATGIVAQSIGGGGGNGGSATSGSIAGGVAIAVSVGGGGGEGGNGKKVTVTNQNTGSIQTTGANSDGVFAQSIGGGGGTGGSATSATLAFPIKLGEVEIPAITINATVGGRGGGGGTAGEVAAKNYGEIGTSGFMSNGVFAQSVGGSGGRGGNSTNLQGVFDATISGTVAVGGSGGDGSTGNTVTVDNSGQITTHGDWSSGVFAQSVGGGGGLGGNATTLALSLSPPPGSPDDLIPTPSLSFDLAIGGDGGVGAIGGGVTVNNLAGGTIKTTGKFAPGVMAQSVGGAGGAGGDARIIQIDLSANPMDFIPLLDLMSLDVTLAFGGSGGSGSHGGIVTVNNYSNVTTSGAFSHGIVAQSVGGGGGSGGSAVSFQYANTDLPFDIPVVDDIAGLTTVELTQQGSGGAGGDGKNVTLINTGNIRTSGAFAMGIVAQSVAGGGGLVGFFNPQGVVHNEIGAAVFNAFFDTDVGLSFVGSVGGGGTAGQVSVNHTGDIQTLGDGAHAVFAQSAAGTGSAGLADVTVNGLISASGRDACGIYAHSGGGGGNGNITVAINGGSVTGGSGSGAGVCFKDGATNTLTNSGTVASVGGLTGYAIVGGNRNELINNHGVVTGLVNLGAGANALTNYSDGVLNAGPTLNLGHGNLLTNDGMLSPGGVGNVQTTALTGDLVQSDTGVLALDLSLAGTTSDRLNVNGSAQMGGAISLNPVDRSHVVTGTHQSTILTTTGGAAANGLVVIAPTSSLVHYALVYPSANEIAVSTSVDFAPTNLGPAVQPIGSYMNAIVAAGGSDSFAPFIVSLLGLPDDASLAAAYEKLGPGAVGNSSTQSTAASLAFNEAMHSCRQREGDFRFIREGECDWLRLGGGSNDQQRSGMNPGYTQDVVTVAGGLQREFKTDTYLGFGLSYQKTDLSSVYSQVEGERFEAGLMLKRHDGPTRLSGSLSIGYGRYDSRRLVNIVTPGLHAQGQQAMWSVSLNGRVSRDMMSRDDAYVRPMLGLGITHVSRDGYSETGAGAANLNVARASETSVSLHPAVEFGHENRTGADGTLLRQYARVGLTHYLGNHNQHFTFSLQGAPTGVAPVTLVSEAERTFAELSVGVDILRKSGATLRLDYSGQFSGTTSARAFWVKLGMPF